ncbi:hypothetical protein E3N88_28367 [Mikania micrantha]|uniref:Uncharacterized protein n=1 Tax=Mikania micrantha TaxID=192012 RepID=A0A5N6N0A3_9ASTR|nr:hypothetical protein E3N88_28367 [Mikania micrantha]
MVPVTIAVENYVINDMTTCDRSRNPLMANQGERYIYLRFPYVILDDTPSSSFGSLSDPSEASSSASQATPAVPHTPSSPRPVTPPPTPPAQSLRIQQTMDDIVRPHRESLYGTA